MKKLLFAGLVLVLCVGGFLLWYLQALRPVVDAGDEARDTVTIDEGLSSGAIADALRDQNLIRSPLAFKLYLKQHGLDGVLQAGKFVLHRGMSLPEIVEILRSGKAEEMIITVPEGFTLKDIDALLAEKGLIEQGEISECARTCDFSSFEFLPDAAELAGRGGKIEGYLFPDTYFVVANEFVPKFFLERLMTTFRHKIVEDLAVDLAASEYSLHEIVTMASLIEEETRTDAERHVVAGILWKRYDADLGLGVDATVRYILDKPTDEITLADLNFNSPYNTRKFKGLPPGPVASPGIQSIRAALHPQESEYWYYLHDNEGAIHYSKTNEEHNIKRYELLN